ncbi:MAG: tetratricopeptide repeat protein [Planctomycetota bacterium]
MRYRSTIHRKSWIQPLHLLVFCLAAGLFHIAATAGAQAQEFDHFPAPEAEETVEEARERELAKRFLTVLKRNPRLGTALDKIYGYHVGRGSLDTFSSSLEKEATSNEDGAVWMILGLVQLQRGQDAVASDSFSKAEKLLPDQTLASAYLGRALVLTGEIESAAEAYRRAITKKPARADMLQIFKELGRIYQRTGRNQEAIEVWKELEEIFPGDTNVEEQIAAVLAEEGADEAALERYVKLSENIKDRFRQVEMSIRAAQLKAKLGKNDEAIADFEKQLAVVNPSSWLHRDVRSRIEEVFWASSDFDGLVKYYEKWTQEHPEDVDAMMRTARILSIQKRGPEARKWFRNAIEAAPSNVDARQALVEALAADFDYKEAAKEMKALVELEPANPDYLVRWGELVLNDDKLDPAEGRQQAAEIWKKMLVKRGDDAVTVSRLADLLRSAELPEQAIEQYKAAIALKENEPQYREYLGEYLHQLGRKEEALETWQGLAAGDRKTRENLVRLSEVLSTFRYAEMALESMANACEMDPGFGELARYAELLREDEQYELALEKLEQAEPMAEDRELRELLIVERIKNYQANGKLKERIEELENAVAGDAKSDAATWRLLALFREANRQFQPACEAIEQATNLAPGDVVTWETSASLYERSGQFGEAVKAYRKLAGLDRRFLSNYLTQIATLEMRVGNTEEALKAGEDLLAAAPGNSEHYRFFAGLCLQVGESKRGLDALRRNVRANPSDRDALDYLARVLAEEFKTDEAIELYWRSFDEAGDVDSKLPVIEALTELYLRTNRFEMLLERLELTSREENKQREGVMWAAAAHQAAGDLGQARIFLEQLVRGESRDTNLLEQLVTLSQAEYDYEKATDYQRRLNAASPSPEGEYRLAKFLVELGEVDEAQALWLRLAKQRNKGGNGLQTTISNLMSKGQWDTALPLLEKALIADSENWELMAAAMVGYVQAKKIEKAVGIAERVAELPVPLEELTETVKQQIAKNAKSRSLPPGYDPYAMVGSPYRTFSSIYQIKTALSISNPSDPFGMGFGRSSFRTFSPTCFGEVKAMADCIFLIAKETAEQQEFIDSEVQAALKSQDSAVIWRAMRYATWNDPSFAYQGDASEDSAANKLLERLLELEDIGGSMMYLSKLYSQRMNARRGMSASKVDAEQLADIYDRVLQVPEMRASQSPYGMFVISELRQAGNSERADKMLADTIGDMKEPFALVQAAGMMSRSLMIPGPAAVDKEDAKATLDAVIPLMVQAIEITDSKTQNASYVSQSMVQILPLIVRYGELEDAIEITEKSLELQARLTAGMRPSQRNRPTGAGRGMYTRSMSGNYQQVAVAFPQPSGYFSESTIFMLHSLVEATKESEQLEQVTAAVSEWASRQEDDPFLAFARLMAKASVEYWTERPEAAMTTIGQADELDLGSQYVSLMRARMSYENGDIEEALAVIEELKPTNQQMLVDKELTLLSLLLQLGDLDRAKKSAQKLFVLRLDSQTEFKLADLMYQLGMKDMGDRMMGRIRRKAGGKQDTLNQLMQRYVAAGELESAAEIARQLIRRTSPATGSRRTSSNSQHEQALRVLVQAKQIDDLIERYEGLVERSPKSTTLNNQLAAMYTAAGRRKEAGELRAKFEKVGPKTATSLIEQARQLSSSRKHEEAVDKYIEAIRKNPQLLDNEYYNMRTAFKNGKGWPKFVKMMREVGIEKFQRSSYRFGEIVRELTREKQYDEARELFKLLLDGDMNAIRSAMLYIGRDSNFKPDAEIIEKLVKQLKQQRPTTGVQYVYSRSNNGTASGLINYMTRMVSGDKERSAELVEHLAAALKERPDSLFESSVLAMLYIQANEKDKAESLVSKMLKAEAKDPMWAQAMWAIASEFAQEKKSFETVSKIMEEVVASEDQSIKSYESRFENAPSSLLVYAFEQTGQKERARKLLVKAMEDLKVDKQQDQYNPGYGEYQYISSMDSLARRLLNSGAVAEAYVAYSKAYADEAMLKRTENWSGSSNRRKDQLQKSITAKMTNEVVFGLLEKALLADAETAGQSFLLSPKTSGDTWTGKRVSLPLEGFVKSAGKDPKLKLMLIKCLEDSKVDFDKDEKTLPQLVSRIVLLSKAGMPENLRTSELERVNKWISENPAVESDDLADPALNAELLLSVMARSLQEATLEGEEAISVEELSYQLLERSIYAADSLKRNDLAFGLRVQLASQVAARDKKKAEKLYFEALDVLLPQDKE